MHCVRRLPIMTSAPIHISPIIGAFAMRLSLSHPATGLPWQLVIDFALPS
jgi:hypothetical protein